MPAPAAGMLLVANPFMLDPNFRRMVVLLVAHSEEGSLGFVLSKPLGVGVDDVVNQLKGWAAPLYQGGPVELETLHFIHRQGHTVPDTEEICPGVYYSGNFARLVWLASTGQVPCQDFRFFLGYSGWGVGQLQAEQRQRSWLITPATTQLVFQQAEGAWESTIRSMGGDVARMVHIPVDPAQN